MNAVSSYSHTDWIIYSKITGFLSTECHPLIKHLCVQNATGPKKGLRDFPRSSVFCPVSKVSVEMFQVIYMISASDTWALTEQKAYFSGLSSS